MTLSERLEAARHCQHLDRRTGASLVVASGSTFGRCWGCDGSVLLEAVQPLTMQPYTVTQSSVTRRAARRSRLWRHTLGPLLALGFAAWALATMIDASPESAWLVVR